MSFIDMIFDSNIDSDKVLNKVCELLTENKRFLHITETKSIKELRQTKAEFNKLVIPYKPEENNKNANFFTFLELQKFLSLSVYEKKNYISNADQKYILTKVIDYLFHSDTENKNLFLNVKHELFELYNFLQFYNIKPLSDETLKQIKKDYAEFEYKVFYLYNLFFEAIRAIIEEINCGVHNSILEEYDIKLFDKGTDFKSIETYFNRFKNEIESFLKTIDIVLFDSFFMFDDYEKYILTSAIKQGKSVYLIAKFNPTDRSTTVLYDNNYALLAKEMGLTLKIPSVEYDEVLVETALDYLKLKFSDIELRIDKKTKNLINDDSVVTIEPFVNREAELKYVVASISNYLKSLNSNNPKVLKEVLQNDIAVIMMFAESTDKYRLSQLFKENGLFIYKGNERLAETEFANIDTDSFAEVYYNKNDFLDTDIKDKNGNALSSSAKSLFFKEMFSCIDVDKTPRPITTYPIAHYIIQLYNITVKGMSIEGFKLLLFSNWKNVIDSSNPKWQNLMGTIKYIERYVENKKDIKDWIIEIEKLLVQKEEISNNSFYKYHPLFKVSKDKLLTILQILYDLQGLLSIITKTYGSLEKHAQVLQHYVMDADKILSIDREDLEFQQVIIQRFHDALDQIGSSSFINNWENSYFASNLQNIIKDWEKDLTEESGDLRLNIVNLANMKKFKRSYLIMCEASRFPRRYIEKFPFANSILDILKSEKYGINRIPSSIKGLEYHLLLEDYLFKNVIDFTTEKLIITLSENDNGFKNVPSIYVEDIYSAFDKDIIFSKPEVNVNEKVRKPKYSDIPSLRLKKREYYTLTELATYKLCPKLFFYSKHLKLKDSAAFFSRFQLKFYMEAVLYCDLFDKFKRYNKNFRKVYCVHENEYFYVVLKLFEETCNENLKYFSFFSEYEIKDVKEAVLNKMVGFFCNNVIKSKEAASYFTIYDVPPQYYKGDSYDLVIEYDTLVRMNNKSRVSQNTLYTEFLILKTGELPDNIVHYAQMIDALDENAENCDRINLVMRIIGKINIQFDSIRYANDGIVRTNNLVKQINNQDFMQAKPKKSRYCKYCKINAICKENYVYTKRSE